MPLASGTLAQRPASGTLVGDPYFDTDAGDTYIWTGSIWKKCGASAGGGGASWGNITGTLSAQTDLDNALGNKVATNDARLSDDRTPLVHGSGKHSVAYEPANANIQTHVASAHAPSNAQKNSDITKAEVEAKLTGAITSHTHAGQPIGLTVLANDTLAQALATNINTKLTVTAARTLTTTVPAAGTRCSVLILTSGTVAYVVTFGTGFKPTGTLSTGTVSARIFVVNFISDGTNLYEAGRTAAMVA